MDYKKIQDGKQLNSADIDLITELANPDNWDKVQILHSHLHPEHVLLETMKKIRKSKSGWSDLSIPQMNALCTCDTEKLFSKWGESEVCKYKTVKEMELFQIRLIDIINF